MYYKSSAHVTNIQIETHVWTIRKVKGKQSKAGLPAFEYQETKTMTIAGTALKYSAHQ